MQAFSITVHMGLEWMNEWMNVHDLSDAKWVWSVKMGDFRPELLFSTESIALPDTENKLVIVCPRFDLIIQNIVTVYNTILR